MSSRQPMQMGIQSTMGDDYQLTLRHLFDHGLTVQPNQKMITYCDNGQVHTLTNGEFKAIQPRLASSLSSLGFAVGDIAASFMWNTPRHLSLYYTVPNMGGCLLPLNIRLHPKELEYIISYAAPKIMFIDANLLPLFKLIPATALKSVQHYIICGKNMQSGAYTYDAKAAHISPVMDYDLFLQTRANNNYIWPRLSHRSGAFLFFTSGTTGNPKGIVYSHRCIYLTTISNELFSRLDTVLMLHPFFHAGGGFMPFYLMSQGFKSLFPNNCYDFAELLEFSRKEAATQMLGVPTMILGLANALKANPKKYETFRGKLQFSTGGSAVPGYLVRWLWDEWKIEVRHGWAMSEVFPGSLGQMVQRRVDLNKSSEEQAKNVTVQGILSPLLETKLVNPDNMSEERKKDGIEVGELLVRGPGATRMYFKNAKPSNFIDGWLKTGDICSITPWNVMKITDRSKDLIKSGGEWISSVDMENYTMKLDEVDMACVVGVPHPKWRERPVVIVVLAKNKTLSKERVLSHIGTKFARFQVPDDVLFWDEIPMTSTGKLSKKTVRERLAKEGYKLPSEQKVKALKSKL